MIPAIIAGAGALIGIGANVYAASKNDEANSKINKANSIVEDATREATKAKDKCQISINDLAVIKSTILKGNLKEFVKYFSKIKTVNFQAAGIEFEFNEFRENDLINIRDNISSIEGYSANDIVGGVAGTALAVGAVDMIAGGALLSGSGIAIGGLAGGAALGVVAAPVFAVTGVISAAKAATNYENACSYLSQAYLYEEECQTYSEVAYAVGDRCNLYTSVLKTINNKVFTEAVQTLKKIVKKKNTIPNRIKNAQGKCIYTVGEMQAIACVGSLAKMINTIINAKILDENGDLVSESKEVVERLYGEIQTGKIQNTLTAYNEGKLDNTLLEADSSAKSNHANSNQNVQGEKEKVKKETIKHAKKVSPTSVGRARNIVAWAIGAVAASILCGIISTNISYDGQYYLFMSSKVANTIALWIAIFTFASSMIGDYHKTPVSKVIYTFNTIAISMLYAQYCRSMEHAPLFILISFGIAIVAAIGAFICLVIDNRPCFPNYLLMLFVAVLFSAILFPIYALFALAMHFSADVWLTITSIIIFIVNLITFIVVDKK